MRLELLCFGAVLAVALPAGPSAAQTVGRYGIPGNHLACSRECCGNDQCFGADCQVCVRACVNPHPHPDAEKRYRQLRQLCTSFTIKGFNKPR